MERPSGEKTAIVAKTSPERIPTSKRDFLESRKAAASRRRSSSTSPQTWTDWRFVADPTREKLIELTPHRSLVGDDDAILRMRIAPRTTGDWYSIRLNQRPTAPVRVSIALSNDAVSVLPKDCFFDVENWERPQHVHIEARQWDAIHAARGVVEVRHGVFSEDDLFEAAPVRAMTVHCFKGSSTSVLSFGTSPQGQLGPFEVPEKARLEGYANVRIPDKSISTLEFAQSYEQTLHEHSNTKVHSFEQRREYRAALEELKSPNSRVTPEEDPDATKASYISSDSEVPVDGDMTKYIGFKLARRHEDHRSSIRQGDRVLAMAAGQGHSLLATCDGHVYACGENASGQLGLGDTTDRRTQMTLINFNDEEKEEEPVTAGLFTRRVMVAEVACGASHSAVISSSGVLYVWGSGQSGQLGLRFHSGQKFLSTKPARVDFPTNSVVTKVSCGASHTVCAVVRGPGSAPLRDDNPESANRLYAWGSATSGALGLGPSVNKEVSTPTEVESMRGQTVKQISCGFYHTALVDGDGSLYTCGLGDKGALGRKVAPQEARTGPVSSSSSARGDGNMLMGTPSSIYGRVLLPRHPSLGGRVLCLSVAAGGGHTVILCSNREVLTCGDNAMGQLGVGDTRPRFKLPQRVQLLAGKAVCGVAAGYQYSACWTDSGLAYAWGEATYGRLSSTVYVAVPSLMPVASYARVSQLVFGHGHTLAVTEHSVETVRRMVHCSRDFEMDAGRHLRLAHTCEEAENAALALPFHQLPQRRGSMRFSWRGVKQPENFVEDGIATLDLNKERAKAEADRRIWTRRCKLHKVVRTVDAEMLVNRRAQLKLVAAVEAASLAKVLKVVPPNYLPRRQKAKLTKRPWSAPARRPSSATARRASNASATSDNDDDVTRRQKQKNAETCRVLAASILASTQVLFHDRLALQAAHLENAAQVFRVGVSAISFERPGRCKLGLSPNHPLRCCVGHILRRCGYVALINLRCACLATRAAFDTELVPYVENLLKNQRARREKPKRRNVSSGITPPKLALQGKHCPDLDSILADLDKRTLALEGGKRSQRKIFKKEEEEEEEEEEELFDDDDDDGDESFGRESVESFDFVSSTRPTSAARPTRCPAGPPRRPTSAPAVQRRKTMERPKKKKKIIMPFHRPLSAPLSPSSREDTLFRPLEIISTALSTPREEAPRSAWGKAAREHRTPRPPSATAYLFKKLPPYEASEIGSPVDFPPYTPVDHQPAPDCLPQKVPSAADCVPRRPQRPAPSSRPPSASQRQRRKKPPVDNTALMRKQRATMLLGAAYTARRPVVLTEPVLKRRSSKGPSSLEDCVDVVARLKQILRTHPISTATSVEPSRKKKQHGKSKQRPSPPVAEEAQEASHAASPLDDPIDDTFVDEDLVDEDDGVSEVFPGPLGGDRDDDGGHP